MERSSVYAVVDDTGSARPLSQPTGRRIGYERVRSSATGLQIETTWAFTHKAWNKLMHALHGNGSAADEDDFDQALAEDDEDALREVELQVGGYYQMVPMLVLWRDPGGSAAVAVPSWSMRAASDEYEVPLMVSGAEAPLPPGSVTTICFVMMSAETMEASGPSSQAAQPWNARYPSAWPRIAETVAIGAQLGEPPRDFETAASHADSQDDEDLTPRAAAAQAPLGAVAEQAARWYVGFLL